MRVRIQSGRYGLGFQLLGLKVRRQSVDEFIDLSLNYRQSGHPGGSRSKVHLLLALMLAGL